MDEVAFNQITLRLCDALCFHRDAVKQAIEQLLAKPWMIRVSPPLPVLAGKDCVQYDDDPASFRHELSADETALLNVLVEAAVPVAEQLAHELFDDIAPWVDAAFELPPMEDMVQLVMAGIYPSSFRKTAAWDMTVPTPEEILRHATPAESVARHREEFCDRNERERLGTILLKDLP